MSHLQNIIVFEYSQIAVEFDGLYTLCVLFSNYHIVECSFLRTMLHKSCVVCVFVAMLMCIPNCVLVLHNQLLINSFTFHQISFMLYIPLNHSNRNVYPSASAGLTCPLWNVSLSQVPPSYIIIARLHCPTQINPWSPMTFFLAWGKLKIFCQHFYIMLWLLSERLQLKTFS